MQPFPFDKRSNLWSITLHATSCFKNHYSSKCNKANYCIFCHNLLCKSDSLCYWKVVSNYENAIRAKIMWIVYFIVIITFKGTGHTWFLSKTSLLTCVSKHMHKKTYRLWKFERDMNKTKNTRDEENRSLYMAY